MRDRFRGNAVHRQRDRVDGGREQVCPGPCGLEGGCERVPARALAVEADREARDVA